MAKVTKKAIVRSNDVCKKTEVFSRDVSFDSPKQLKNTIRKKTWPEYFQKILDGKKNCELRLADFNIKEGDTLILEEWDPKTGEYTGRKIEKVVKNLTHVFPLDFASFEELEECGQYIIEME